MKTIRIILTAVSVICFSIMVFGQSPQMHCDLVDPRIPNHDSFFPICDLNILNGFTSVMTDSITGNGPSTLCPNGGAPHNITWFSFIAPDGEYSIILTPGNCTDSNGVPPGTGIQSGIYTDCTFSEQVGPCIGIPCSQSPNEIPNIDPLTGEQILNPGQIYYWFTDGCSGTICEYEITITGNVIPFSQDTNGELDFTVLEDSSFNSYRANYFGEITNAGDFYWSIEPASYEVLNGDVSGAIIHTQDNFLDVHFLEDQNYTVCLDSIVSKCSFTETSICSEITPPNAFASGISFLDIDENGILDPSEYRLPNARIKSGTKSIYTNELGEYTLPVDAGSISINARLPYSFWIENPLQIDTFLGSSDLDSINFPFRLGAGDYNLITSIPPLRTRCNTIDSIEAVIFNSNNIPVSVLVYVELDECLVFEGSKPMTDSIVGNRYYFNADILPGSKFIPQLEVSFPGVEKVGDSVNVQVYAEELSFGSESLTSRTQVFRCSYDPNDKTVSPDRDGDENWTLRDERLDYHIRFQNNGNDTAFHVQIVDVINDNIDLNTLLLLDNSHPVTITTNEDTLFFDFYGIELVDSMTNFEGSQGFVTFTVETVDGVPENTVIENTAGIYFDLNPPIITNTVQNTIVTFLPCPPVKMTLDTSVCRVDLPIGLYGYFESGTYVDTFNLFDNCDSIRTLELMVNEETFSEIEFLELCDGESIIIDGIEYSEDGEYQIIVGPNANGCDSFYLFRINYNFPAFTVLPAQLICFGDTIDVAGVSITEAASYTLPAGQTSLGCDSSVFINVEFDSDVNCNTYCEILPNNFLYDHCDSTQVYCDLKDLDSICFTMLEEETGNGPTPICSSGGAPHNISWIAFVAGEGNYWLQVVPNNCVAAVGNPGISFGVYTDCSFSEEVFCIGLPTTEDTIIVANRFLTGEYALIPGETYYMFMDGASGSVCDIQMNVVGDYTPYSFQVSDADLLCEQLNGGQSCSDTLFTNESIRLSAATVINSSEWVINRVSGDIVPDSWTSSGIENAGRISTDSNFIDITFLEEGVFSIAWLGNDHDCFSPGVIASREFVVGRSVANINEIFNPILEVFPNPTKDRITYTLNTPQKSTYTIMSLQGKVLISGRGNGSQVEVDLLDFTQGIYILEVITVAGERGVKKLVKLN